MRRSTSEGTSWPIELGFDFGKLEAKLADPFLLLGRIATKYSDFGSSKVRQGLPILRRELLLPVEPLPETERPILFRGLKHFVSERRGMILGVEFHSGIDVAVVNL